MEWISLIQTLGAAVGGLGLGMFTKSGRRRDKADADAKVAEAQRTMIDNYEERIKELHGSIDRLNKEVDYYIGRVSEQNHVIDSKTELIRSVNQKLWESEQETNRVNDQLNTANERIIRLTEEVAHLREWKCVIPWKDCKRREPEQRVKHDHYTAFAGSSNEPQHDNSTKK